jgi:hypothetical protein
MPIAVASVYLYHPQLHLLFLPSLGRSTICVCLVALQGLQGLQGLRRYRHASISRDRTLKRPLSACGGFVEQAMQLHHRPAQPLGHPLHTLLITLPTQSSPHAPFAL